ncbi:hypothetical protein RRG08_026805 [Elysia crispata]|uniref:Uncharacterized protein n=1 Tax=Elysia crispata TaxID=231223 RepID=A0AAE1AQ66_9GAST|nr:hypothetical protein RRG08_026805 [Elysia crispata]
MLDLGLMTTAASLSNLLAAPFPTLGADYLKNVPDTESVGQGPRTTSIRVVPKGSNSKQSKMPLFSAQESNPSPSYQSVERSTASLSELSSQTIPI